MDGRPVFRLGTDFSAAKNAVSCMAAIALIPARNNSVFLAGLPNFAARIFNPSSTAYSSLGKVKLSRTIFGFLSLTGLGGVSFADAFATGLAVGLTVGLAGAFAAPTDCLVFGATFTTAVEADLATGFVVALVTAVFAATGFSVTATLSITVMGYLSS